MANTAFIEAIESLPDGGTRIIVTVTDNISAKVRIDRTYSAGTTLEQLKANLSSAISGAATSDELKKLPLNIAIDLTPTVIPPPPPPPPPVPTQEELDLAEFRITQANWRSARHKIEDGTIKDTDADALALLTDLQSKYKVIYLTVD